MINSRVLFSIAFLTFGALIVLISAIRIAQPELLSSALTPKAFASDDLLTQEASPPASL